MSNQNSDTIFRSFVVGAYTGDLETADCSDYSPTVEGVTDRFDALAYLTQSALMNTGESITVTPPMAYATEWLNLCVKVIGTIDVVTAGKDYQNVGVIAGHTYCYGTAYWPGFLCLETKNITAPITITAKSDGTKIDVLSAVIVPSTDTRLL